jgi:toxin-antitoxin system PIN domain toxin
VLVHAHRRQAPQHEPALAALRRLAEGPAAWGLPVFVVGEFLRVVTHPSIFERPSTTEDAMAVLEDLLSSPSVRLLAPGSRYWVTFREVVRDARTTGNGIFDAQIAAVCLEHGATTILTEDRGFRVFSGLTVRGLG